MHLRVTESVKTILVDIVAALQQIHRMCTNRTLRWDQTVQELVHDTTFMQAILDAYQSETTGFLNLLCNIAPYIDMIDGIQDKKNKHIRKMCIYATSLSQEQFDQLPMHIKAEVAHRLT